MKKRLQNIGPGALVTAAFIGPGTVTVCTLAGVQFGYTLLWALMISIVTCIVMQEMAVRLGVITQQGLSEVIKSQIKNKVFRWIVITLVVSAIVIGNAAYETGNISGGILGLSTIIGMPTTMIGNVTVNYSSILIGAIAFVLLYVGNYKVLERSLIVLVLLMSLTFVITAILTKPDFSQIINGFVPDFSSEKIFTVIALIGTTVVPYNLFLHASLVSEKWKTKDELSIAQKDSSIAIAIGGVVSMAIIITGAAMQSKEIHTIIELSESLEPLFGKAARYVLAVGLFAAGITSAITAPLAAAYVVKGCLGWDAGLKTFKFRSIWMIILLLGVVFSSLGIKSIEIIQFAQFTNGLLLPIIAGFLLWAMNRSVLLGEYVNTRKQNIIGVLIVIITIFLGIKGIWIAIT